MIDAALRYGPTLVAILALSGGAWWFYEWAWDRGYAAHKAEVADNTRRLEIKLKNVSDYLSEVVRKMEEERTARERLVEEMEDAARADPDADRPALSAGSVRRLRERWGAAP